MTTKKDLGGRRPGIPKKTIGFKVPVHVAELVKDEIRPLVEKSVKKHLKIKP